MSSSSGQSSPAFNHCFDPEDESTKIIWNVRIVYSITKSKIEEDLDLQQYHCKDLNYCMLYYLAHTGINLTDIKSSDNPNNDFFIQLHTYTIQWNVAPTNVGLHCTFLLLEVIKYALLGFIKINCEIINLHDKTINFGLCFYTGKNTMKVLRKQLKKVKIEKMYSQSWSYIEISSTRKNQLHEFLVKNLCTMNLWYRRMDTCLYSAQHYVKVHQKKNTHTTLITWCYTGFMSGLTTLLQRFIMYPNLLTSTGLHFKLIQYKYQVHVSLEILHMYKASNKQNWSKC